MIDSNQIRVVVFREGDVWVAQCLEYDIGAQAPDLETLHRRLALTVELERRISTERNGKAFAGIDPAPKHFQDMWAKRSGGFTPKSDGYADLQLALVA